MMSVFWVLFLVALGFAVVEMTITFLVAQRWRNYGMVDVVWSGGFAIIALMAFAGVTAVTIGRYREMGHPDFTLAAVRRWGFLTLMVVSTHHERLYPMVQAHRMNAGVLVPQTLRSDVAQVFKPAGAATTGYRGGGLEPAGCKPALHQTPRSAVQ